MLTIRLSLLTLLLSTVTSEKFFDPTHSDFMQCGFTRPSLLCDPDGVLNAAYRNHLYNELKMFEPRTSLRKRGQKGYYCLRAGITPAIYLVRHGDKEKMNNITAFMRKSWSIDQRCQNILTLVLSANETSYHVYRNLHAKHQTPLNNNDVGHYLNREVDNIIEGKFGAVLSNVLKKSLERATAKYQQWSVETFPNPMSGGHVDCGMNKAGPLCDPDGIFDEDERRVLLENIAMFEAQTRNSPVHFSRNSTYCRGKGYSIGLAVMRNVRGAILKSLSEITHDMLDSWKLDDICDKHIVIGIAVDETFSSFVVPSDSVVDVDKFNKYVEDSNSIYPSSELRLLLRGVFASAAKDAHSGALFNIFNRRIRRSVNWRL